MEILKVGPLGEHKHARHWEESCTDPISHIFVTFDDTELTSVQFGYVKEGALVLSKKYGQRDTEEHSTRIVRLNHESEFVTGISGELWGSCIFSLTFHTNEGKHEAFQVKVDSLRGRRPDETKEFHSGIRDRREFGGFFGSSDNYDFYSIGLYIRPVLSTGKPVSFG